MSKRSNKLYLYDILSSGKAILDYVKDMNFEEFEKDRKTYQAVIREFEIIGEAIGNLSSEIKNKYKEIYWQDIKDFRNILTHEYFGVDLEIVWNVIKSDLPSLLEVVNKILSELEQEK